ncbi:hypothetical protein BGW39_002416 [Mortierella sp. 14UC]|nr:hypothetical protein BGW39_002416 [Mortierella sp. 14UC]
MSAIPETFLKSYRPETFDGRHRDIRAEDWLIRFERYCKAARIPETGQDRILCAGLLLTDSASRWYDQLGTISEATINGTSLSPYGVFKYKFRQRFVDSNDAEDAFDRLRDLRQKRSVNEYVILFEKFRSRITHFDDKDAVRFFRGGLKPEIRQLVDNHPEIADDDINGLIALAERLDKMNKHERQFTRTFRPPQTPRAQETFPQPMELDAIHAHPNTQSKFQRPQSKDEAKKSDLAKGLCFYCHEQGHMIGSCPKRNKKPSNSRAH